MMTDAYGMPLAGAGPKCKGIIPDSEVLALTSSNLIGAARVTVASAVSARRNIWVSPASTRNASWRVLRSPPQLHSKWLDQRR